MAAIGCVTKMFPVLSWAQAEYILGIIYLLARAPFVVRYIAKQLSKRAEMEQDSVVFQIEKFQREKLGKGTVGAITNALQKQASVVGCPASQLDTRVFDKV